MEEPNEINLYSKVKIQFNIDIIIDGKPVNTELDIGAAPCTMSVQDFERLKIQKNQKEDS